MILAAMFDLLSLSINRNQGQLPRGKTEPFLYRIDSVYHLLQSKMDLGITNPAVSEVSPADV